MSALRPAQPEARRPEDLPSGFYAWSTLANLEYSPSEYVWHHHQDGKTMQLVPKNIHEKTGHTGGVGLNK